MSPPLPPPISYYDGNNGGISISFLYHFNDYYDIIYIEQISDIFTYSGVMSAPTLSTVLQRETLVSHKSFYISFTFYLLFFQDSPDNAANDVSYHIIIFLLLSYCVCVNRIYQLAYWFQHIAQVEMSVERGRYNIIIILFYYNVCVHIRNHLLPQDYNEHHHHNLTQCKFSLCICIQIKFNFIIVTAILNLQVVGLISVCNTWF